MEIFSDVVNEFCFGRGCGYIFISTRIGNLNLIPVIYKGVRSNHSRLLGEKNESN